jgi:hypothetical protein
VQRIDADTIDIASNVSGAQRELLKYYASISSNRWLMLKVFGVLIVFVCHFTCGTCYLADCFYSSWYLFSCQDEHWAGPHYLLDNYTLIIIMFLNVKP